MSPLPRIAAGLAIAFACGPVFAQSAGFGLSLRVLPPSTTEQTVELPTPPRAQALPRGNHDKRLLYAGSADEAERFYETALPALGYYRTERKPHGAVWERGDVRTELLFYPVTGQPLATGILIRSTEG
ncbi:hypothetical protein [Lysobacter terrae]